jgi:hypothetical protein
LDAMDVLLYVFALQSVRAEFGLTNAVSFRQAYVKWDCA